jgi:hypothetical protein
MLSANPMGEDNSSLEEDNMDGVYLQGKRHV